MIGKYIVIRLGCDFTHKKCTILDDVCIICDDIKFFIFFIHFTANDLLANYVGCTATSAICQLKHPAMTVWAKLLSMKEQARFIQRMFFFV